MNEFLSSTMYSYSIQILLGVAVSVILFFCVRPRRIRRLKALGLQSEPPREIVLFIYFVYIGVLGSLLLFPTNIFPDHLEYNFVPTIFYYLTGSYSSGIWVYIMFIGNIILFIPFAFFIPLLWKSISFGRLLIVCVIAIFCVEIIQPFFGRSFDTNDIVLNLMGCLLGFLIFCLLNRFAPEFVLKFKCKRFE